MRTSSRVHYSNLMTAAILLRNYHLLFLFIKNSAWPGGLEAEHIHRTQINFNCCPSIKAVLSPFWVPENV
jgi:hypothetical protein